MKKIQFNKPYLNEVDSITNIYEICNDKNESLCWDDQDKGIIQLDFENLNKIPFQIFKDDYIPMIIKINMKSVVDENYSEINEFVNLNYLSPHAQAEVKKDLIMRKLLR